MKCRLFLFLIVSIAVLVATVNGASAQLAVGPVTITGTLYVNGAQSKVACSGKDGNFIDSSTFGMRTFSPALSCPLILDTGTNGIFVFGGEEDQIIQGNKIKSAGVFNGGIVNDSPAFGTVHGQITFKQPPLIFKTDKGIITYSYFDGTNSIVFFGKYAAKF